MKNIFLLLTIAFAIVACTGKSAKGEESAKVENTADSTVVSEVNAEESVSTELPISKEEALRAWNDIELIENVKPDSYLCYDIDKDGKAEVFLVNKKEAYGNARAIFTVNGNKLEHLLSTVYPAPGAALWKMYVGDKYLLNIVENRGKEFTAYLMKDSKVYSIAYNSMRIVGWDEEADKPIYEFDEEGQAMIGKDFDHLEPSDEAGKYLNPEGLTEIMDLKGWQEF